jgi:hypothetical protein
MGVVKFVDTAKSSLSTALFSTAGTTAQFTEISASAYKFQQPV